MQQHNNHSSSSQQQQQQQSQTQPSSSTSLRIRSNTNTKAPRAPRRRIRSESDRKKHAGWRHCPRCHRSVSTNGRNFYHHMYKCDRVYFADLIAKVDSAKTPVSTPLPPAIPSIASSPITPPSLPPRLPSSPLKSFSQNSNIRRNGFALSEMQRIVYVEQLSFLRIYDRTVDSVISQLEKADFSVFSTSIFEAVRQAKLKNANRNNFTTFPQSHHHISISPPYSPLAPPIRRTDNPLPLPDTIASPNIPNNNYIHHNSSALSIPSTVPTSNHIHPIHTNGTITNTTNGNNLNHHSQPSQSLPLTLHSSTTRQPSAMSISSVINN